MRSTVLDKKKSRPVRAAGESALGWRKSVIRS